MRAGPGNALIQERRDALMKGRNLVVMVVLAAVLVGVAVLTSREKGESTPDVVGGLLFPDLPVNDVEKIVIRSGRETATVARLDKKWVAPGKFNYPADFTKIRDTLLKLSDLRIGQLVRVDDDQRASLKLNPPVPGDVSGTLVELHGKEGETLASLLLGEPRHRKRLDTPNSFDGYADGRYVSTDGGNNVYLVSETLQGLSVNMKDWLDTDLVNVMSSDIAEITINGPDRDTVRLTREKDGGTLRAVGLSKKEEADTSRIDSIESALSYLRFNDIADPSLSDEQTGTHDPVVFRAITKEGEIYTVRIGGSPEDGNDRYVRFNVALTPAGKTGLPKTDVEDDEEGEEAEKTAKEQAQDKEAEKQKQLNEKVRSLGEKLDNWTYLISSYKADPMMSVRADLVKKKGKAEK